MGNSGHPVETWRSPSRSVRLTGFTVIEMLVVMTVVALLVSVMAPAYVRHVDRAREVVLKQNLAVSRDAIDKFRADRGRLPLSFQELIAGKYLRAVPVDPINERQDTWLFTPSVDGSAGIADLHSGSQGTAQDGSRYANW